MWGVLHWLPPPLSQPQDGSVLRCLPEPREGTSVR